MSMVHKLDIADDDEVLEKKAKPEPEHFNIEVLVSGHSYYFERVNIDIIDMIKYAMSYNETCTMEIGSQEITIAGKKITYLSVIPHVEYYNYYAAGMV